MTQHQDWLERLQGRFGDGVAGSNLEAIDPWIELTPNVLVEACRYLRDDAEMRFDVLNLISGVDYLQVDPKKAAKTDWEPHIEVVYHLSSIAGHHSLVLKVMLPRWKDDQEGQLPEVPSVVSIWPTANWHEREVFDLTGIRFVGHPGLHRILLPEDWDGYPLRKDYEMPTDYHGIQA